MRARRVVFTFVIVSVVVGCDTFDLIGHFTQANAIPLSIYPAAVAVRPGDPVDFVAVGGRPPYLFSLKNSGGKIDHVTGAYTAPTNEGDYEIKLLDDDGTTRFAAVFVIQAKALAITPTTRTVQTNEEFEFNAYGGNEPYTFSFASDDPENPVGTITEEGLFTAGGAVGSGIVTLGDGDSIVTARVYVQDGATLMLTPTENPIQQGQSVLLHATGGDNVYHYTINAKPSLLDYDAGYGSVSPGVYTASDSIGVVEISVTDGGGNTYDLAMTILPTTPTDFAVSGATGDPKTIRITWNHDKPGATGFRIERWSDGVNFTTIADSSILGPEARSYLDRGLQPNEPYEYRMYTYRSEQYESLPTAAILGVANP